MQTVPKAKVNLKKVDDEPVYLITSFRRSGTSMMARCLHGGGLPVVYTEMNDRRFNDIRGFGGRSRDDYYPNPNGFFSIEGFMDYELPTFYEENKGKVLKIPRMDLFYLPQGNYKLIFMTRDPEEILASYRDFIGLKTWGLVECSVHFYDMLKKATIDLMLARGDVDVLEVEYKHAVMEPLATFMRIRDFGVPIDVNKSAALVDPALYRHKIEKK